MVSRLLLAGCSIAGLWCAMAIPAEADDRVVYAPDVLGVDRIFMIALKTPADSPAIAVKVTDHVVLLDQSPPDKKQDVRRFYFRTVKPAKSIDIRFALAGGDAVVPVTIWSFKELLAFRKHKNKQLPRRWPLG